MSSAPPEAVPDRGDPFEPAQAVPAAGVDLLQPLHWRTSVLLSSAFGTVLLMSLVMLLPVPFVVLRPGPAINTLGSKAGHRLITVTGHPTYPAQGELDLTTVTVAGGPDARLSLLVALDAWFDGSLSVIPQDVMYPPGQTVESSRQQNAQEMTTSQESATVAALRTLGIKVPTTITVAGVDGGTPESPLRPKDVIVEIGGTAADGLDTLRSVLAKVTPGDRVPVTVRRDGVDVKLSAPTRRWTDGRTVLGIQVDPTFRFPFEVKIQIDDVGGPSAGTMFALGIIDTLTPGDLTGGQHIAGTGTIDDQGVVGPIGGIRQKMVGARDAGATWFLVPAENCPDIAGHVPDGLRTVRIDTLVDARRSVEQIGTGKGLDSLPHCAG